MLARLIDPKQTVGQETGVIHHKSRASAEAGARWRWTSYHDIIGKTYRHVLLNIYEMIPVEVKAEPESLLRAWDALQKLRKI
jgi:hypothetical protein